MSAQQSTFPVNNIYREYAHKALIGANYLGPVVQQEVVGGGQKLKNNEPRLDTDARQISKIVLSL